MTQVMVMTMGRRDGGSKCTHSTAWGGRGGGYLVSCLLFVVWPRHSRRQHYRKAQRNAHGVLLFLFGYLYVGILSVDAPRRRGREAA